MTKTQTQALFLFLICQIFISGQRSVFAQKKFLEAPPKSATPSHQTVELKAAIDSFKRHNYQEAIKGLTPLANGGDLVAARYLGSIYEEGLIGNTDLGKAEFWLRKAATGGDIEAMLRLAGVINFKYQDKTPESARECTDWLRKAADGGSLLAQSKVATRYSRGLGAPLSLPLTYKYRVMAARQGDEKCALKAAKQVTRGDGIKADMVQAVELYKIAAKAYPEACLKLGQIYTRGAPGVTADRAQASLWKKKAAELTSGYKEDNLSILDSMK